MTLLVSQARRSIITLDRRHSAGGLLARNASQRFRWPKKRFDLGRYWTDDLFVPCCWPRVKKKSNNLRRKWACGRGDAVFFRLLWVRFLTRHTTL